MIFAAAINLRRSALGEILSTTRTPGGAQKLPAPVRQVADEEDVALSAFKSFCRGVEAGRFPSWLIEMTFGACWWSLPAIRQSTWSATNVGRNVAEMCGMIMAEEWSL